MPDSRNPKSDPDLLLNQLADEFAARQRRGERPSLHEYCIRHPELADEIQSLFPALLELERAKADAGPELAVVEPIAASVSLLGDFRLLREVGRGGMGVVYEAEQISLGRRVALKLLPANVFRDPMKKRRFEREARAAAKLHHTNIVPVHGFGEHDGTPYYVMQFIQGLGLDTVIAELRRLPNNSQIIGSLGAPTADPAAMSVALARSLVGDDTAATAGWNRSTPDALSMTAAGDCTPDPIHRGRGSGLTPLSGEVHLPGDSSSSVSGSATKTTELWKSVARIGLQVAGALTYAHKQGVLHRDIKPANLLLDLDGVVWVTDFGLAKADDSDDLTQSGDLVGTVRYMPPEGFEGKSDARSDVYALGLTLFELIALRPAYPERDRKRLIKDVTTGEAPRLRKVRPHAPRDLVTIVEKACEKDPSRRYQSAAALADDLQRFLDGRPITARRATEFEKLWMWARRRPAIAALLAALLLCLSAGAIVSTILAIRADLLAASAADREREATFARDAARRNAEVAEQQRALAEAGQTEAKEQRERADGAAEFARQNLYYAQMHLAPQEWRGGHRSMNHLQELLATWRPEGDGRDRRGWEWFYLNSLPYQNLRTLTESSAIDRPSTVAWHIASKRLAEGTADGLIRIWDVAQERPKLTIRGPAPWLAYWGGRWIDWSPDGKKLAAGFRDTTVRVWDSESGQELQIFRDQNSPIVSVAFDSDGSQLAACGSDGAIKIWNFSTGQLSSELKHPGLVGAGAWSPDGKLFACGHGNGTVTISGMNADDKVVTLGGNFAPISGLAWSPDSTRLAATSTYDYATRIWDVASQKIVLGPLRHSHEVFTVAWEPNGRRLATGSIDETIQIQDAVTGKDKVTLRGNRVAIASLAWGPDGCLASACIDGNVKVWNSIRDQESSTLPAHVGRVHSASWSPNGKMLASGGDDGKVQIWDAATRKSILTITAHDQCQINGQFGLIRSLAWSPDSLYLASVGLDGAAKVWEISSGRLVFALPNDHGSVWSVAWSADGTYLAAGSQDGTIRLVEGIRHTPKISLFQAHAGRVRSLAWSPQGNRLASGGADALVKLWDPIRSVELLHMQGHQHFVVGVAWSPDGNRLASASSDCLVMTWDPQTGQRLATMRGHHAWVEAVTWSPDGTRLASAGTDDSVRIWDPNSGEETFVLRGNSEMFHDISWHSEGAQLAAANDDGQIWIWNATRGFERDTTLRALPYIDRLIASGVARGEDLRCAAECYARAGKIQGALILLKDDLQSLRQFVLRLTESRDALANSNARSNVRALLAEQLASQPKNAAALLELSGDLFAADRDWERAIAAYVKGLASEPANVAVLSKLASAYQSVGRTREAIVPLGASSSLNPTDTILILKIAALQAWFGQESEFATTRRRILNFAQGTTDAVTAERIAKASSLLLSSDKAELETAVGLARKAVEVGHSSGLLPYFQLALGMAEYRNAHFVEADAALVAAVNGAKDNRIIAGTSAFYRAMCLFRQGKSDEARKLATEAAATMRPLPADEKNPLAGSVSHDDLILWLAYKEAKALLELNSKTP